MNLSAQFRIVNTRLRPMEKRFPLPIPYYGSGCSPIPTRPHKRASLIALSRSSVKSNPWELILRRTKRQSKDWGSEREERRGSSQSDHAREVTRVNRTRNNHDSAWKKKKEKSCYRARNHVQGVPEMDRQALGCILLAVRMKITRSSVRKFLLPESRTFSPTKEFRKECFARIKLKLYLSNNEQ